MSGQVDGHLQERPAPAPIGGRACWLGPELVASDEWIVPLDQHQIEALIAAARRMPEGVLVSDDVEALGVPLAELADLAAATRHEIEAGRGFVVLRGLPVHEMSIDELERVYWLLGLHIGIPVQQNGAGDLLLHVSDRGLDYSDPSVRGYQTSARLDYHVDGSDVVGLLCVRAARAGGTSTIVSSTAIHDHLAVHRPDVCALLHQPIWFDRRNGDGPESFYQRPIITHRAIGLNMYYGRSYIDSAQRGPQVPALTDAQIEALDLVDQLANSPELFLPMDLRPGDIQFLDNRLIMHSRTDFHDWPEPERRRDMVRLWLSLDDGAPAEMVP